jgi:titin
MSSSAMVLSWTDASNNEDGFAIERCSSPSCTNFSLFNNAPANATGYLDITVTGGTSYSYRVKAMNGAGSSAFSAVASATTIAAGPVPVAPTSMAASALNSSHIEVTWTDASTNEDGFKIERCQGAGCTNFAIAVTTLAPNGTSYMNGGLLAGTTYRFRVQSYNGSGGSAFAGPVSATTPAATLPNGAPSNLVATAVSSSRINLTWVDNATNEDDFLLERCEGVGCSNFLAFGSAGANGTTFSDQGRSASTSYSYRVKAMNGAGSSAYSGIATAVTQPAAVAPAAPSGLVATATSSTSIMLTWADNSNNEDQFEIERCQGPGCSPVNMWATPAANATTAINSALQPATSYSYRIRARNGAGASAYTAAATATTQATQPSIVLSVTSRSFTAQAGGANPAAQTVQITNGGGGTLGGLTVPVGYQTGEPTGWLTASLNTTTAPATLTLNAATGALAQGTYHALISVTATGASNSPQPLPVTFTVSAPSPVITVTPTTLSFTATAGGASPASQTIQIVNSGGGTLSGLSRGVTYQAGQPTGWLTTTLTATTAPTSLNVAAATGALAAGTYNATITVTGTGAASKTVAVTFTVSSANPQISLSAATRTFNATANGTNPTSQSLQIANSGTGSLTGLQVAESPSASWLTPTLSSTTAPATLTFAVSIAGLAAGTYTTTVNVSSSVASNSPRPVTVTLNLAAPAQTATRFLNNASYPIIYLTIDGVQHFPSSPQAILPGDTYTVNLTAGNHTYEAHTGFWDGGTRFEMYLYGGNFTQTSGNVGSVPINDPTIAQLLTQFDAVSGYWQGMYWEGTTPHTAGFRFYPNGTWRLYIDGSQTQSGNFTLVSRFPDFFQVTFSVGGFQGTLNELYGTFNMPNGPQSWRWIEYTYQGR